MDIQKIRTDGGTQPRAEVNWLIVADYAEQMQEGAHFPPVTVFYDGTDYWLADGFHRVAAAKKIGLLQFDTDVKQGTQEDAIIASCAANATHGLRRSNPDKQRAVETMLRVRPGWSNRQIADHCAVHHDMVGTIRAKLELTGGIRQSDVREGRDGRVYDTSHIGKPPAKPLKPEVQAALTDLVIQAPDEAPAFIARALDERLAPDAIQHARSIITAEDVAPSTVARILTPGEMVHDGKDIAPSEISRFIAAERAKTPEAMSLPVDGYLISLDGCMAISDENITAWLDTTPPDQWHIAESTLARVKDFIERIEQQMTRRRQMRLRVVE